jgi:hypothetical protein
MDKHLRIAVYSPTEFAGIDDPIIPLTNATIMYALLPHATLYLHSGGHIDLIAKAAELAPVIESFRNG